VDDCFATARRTEILQGTGGATVECLSNPKADGGDMVKKESDAKPACGVPTVGVPADVDSALDITIVASHVRLASIYAVCRAMSAD